MEQLDLQLVATFAATTGVAFLMMWSGVQKSLLDWRNRRRHCPSCGRIVAGRVCEACTTAH